MAPSYDKPRPVKSGEPPQVIPVTVQTVVGEIVLDSTGTKTVIEEAFNMIAGYCQDNSKGTALGAGSFSFPDPYGGTVHVDVSST